MQINEKLMVAGQIIESEKSKLPSGVLCRVKYPICNIGELNANNRLYEKSVWDKVLSDKGLQEKLAARALFGHAEHPSVSQSDLQLTSHVVLDLTIDEGKVYQTLDVVDTPTGRIVDTLLRAQCQVGVSTRAEGDLEECEKDGKKYHRVIPESYKYITTDFTADPSTFGVVPVDVRRAAVSQIKAEAQNEKSTANEKFFATKLLESMKCGKDKCEGCGRCEDQKEGAKEAIKEEKKVNEEKVNEEKVNEERVVSVSIRPESGILTANGNVKLINIKTDPETDPVVDITVITTDPKLPALEPKPELPPQEEVDKMAAAGPLPVEDEIPDEEEPVESKVNEAFADRGVAEILGGGGYAVDKEQITKIIDGMTDKEFRALVFNLDRDKDQPIIQMLKDKGYKLTPSSSDGTTESKISENKNVMFVDSLADGRWGVFYMIEGKRPYLTFSFNTEAEARDKGKVIAGLLTAEFLEAKPEGINTESISTIARGIVNLRIKEATARAEKDVAVAAATDLQNKDLEAKIATNKIRRLKANESNEVKALRAKLEEKVKALAGENAKLAGALKVNEDSAQKINTVETEKSKLLEDHKIEIEKVKKESDDLVVKAKAEASCVIIREYVSLKLRGFKQVHDNVRALLEDCQSLGDVDKVLDEYRGIERRRALHANLSNESNAETQEPVVTKDSGKNEKTKRVVRVLCEHLIR